MAYEWRNNIACRAVYNTMEKEDRMDQFESLIIPFDEAGTMKVSDLKFFPDAGSSSVKERAAKHFSDKFIVHVFNDYAPKKQTPTSTLQQLFKDVVKVLKNGDKTLTDLAETMDKTLMFDDE